MHLASLRNSRKTLSAGLLAALCALLPACASGGGTTSSTPQAGRLRGESGFVLCKSAWYGKGVEGCEGGADLTASHNLALRPNDPWVGTVGMKSGVRDAYEVGLGLCVPNPSGEAAPVGRSVGLGCWLTLDF